MKRAAHSLMIISHGQPFFMDSCISQKISKITESQSPGTNVLADPRQ